MKSKERKEKERRGERREGREGGDEVEQERGEREEVRVKEEEGDNVIMKCRCESLRSSPTT